MKNCKLKKKDHMPAPADRVYTLVVTLGHGPTGPGGEAGGRGLPGSPLANAQNRDTFGKKGTEDAPAITTGAEAATRKAGGSRRFHQVAEETERERRDGARGLPFCGGGGAGVGEAPPWGEALKKRSNINLPDEGLQEGKN